MKIAVIGAGGIGCVIAAELHKAGVDVVLIGREDQVDAISRSGLLVKRSDGEEIVRVSVAPRLNKEPDLVIFATKTQDLEGAYQQNCAFLENCDVLTTQNGVQADSIVGIHFGPERKFSSIVMFGANYEKLGEVVYAFPGDWIIGRPDMSIDQRTHRIAEVLRRAFPVVVSENIRGMKYTKLFVNLNNCICAMIGKSMQEVFSNLDMCRLSVRLLKEGLSVVRAAKIELISLPDYPVERLYGFASMPEDHAAELIRKILTTLSDKPVYGSILQSIMRGKSSEIDFINGEIVQIAQAIQQKAPLNDRIVEMVHQVEKTGKYYSFDEIKKAMGNR